MDRYATIELLALAASTVAATLLGAWVLKKVLAWRQHTAVPFKESLIAAAVIFGTAGVFNYVSISVLSEADAIPALSVLGALALVWLQSVSAGRIIHAPNGRIIGTKRAFQAILWTYLIVWIAYLGIFTIVTGGDFLFFIIGIFRTIFSGGVS